MKKLFGIVVLLASCLPLFSQKKQDFIQLRDKDGTVVASTKSAWYFTRIRYINDTCWQFQQYEVIGPLVSSRQFKDPDGLLAHGRSAFMRPNGTLDSTGSFVNGKPHGEWLYFDSIGNLKSKKRYALGSISEVSNEDDDEKADSSGYFYFVEARFQNDDSGWSKYLQRNLRYPPIAFTNRVSSEVEVFFMIDTAGQVKDALLLRSAELTLDDEALRLVRDSPAWIPATQNGMKVDSYLQQRIQFSARELTLIREREGR